MELQLGELRYSHRQNSIRSTIIESAKTAPLSDITTVSRNHSNSSNNMVQANSHTGIFIHSSLQLILRVLNHQIAASSISRLVSPAISRHCQTELIACSQHKGRPFSLKRYIISCPQVGIYEITAIYALTKRSIALTGRICHYDALQWTEMNVLTASSPLQSHPNSLKLT